MRRQAGLAARACAAAALAVAIVHAQAAPRAEAVAHGLIVKLKDASPVQGRAAAARMERLFADAGFGVTHARALGRAARHVDFGHTLGAAEAQALAARLRELPQVAWVVPNEREHRLQVPQDPLYAASATSSGQWWLFPAGGTSANAIDDRLRGVPGVQSAWSRSTGSASAVVAVLDTGITAHPDLNGRVLPGRDFVSTVEYANDGDGWDADPSDPGDWVTAAERAAQPALFGNCEVDDSSWHGTAIAGMIAAATDNQAGAAGVLWTGGVLPVRVAGKCGAEVADIITGMRWAAGLQVIDDQGRPLPLNPNPARVLNISFGSSAPCNAAYQDTIDELRTVGAVVVAAAGNESSTVTRPASCTGVIGVSALNRDGFKASYSNFGPQVTVATVGGDPRLLGAWGLELGDDALLTLLNTGTRGPGTASYGRVAGTSFATPVAAGVAALMLSVNPGLSVQQLIDGVRASARPHVTSQKIAACSDQNPGRCLCTTSTCGAGILDAPQALAYALDPTAYVAPARTPEVIDSPEVDAAVALGPDLPANGGGSSGGASAGGGDGSGGGALGLPWLLALLGAVAALRPARRVDRS